MTKQPIEERLSLGNTPFAERRAPPARQLNNLNVMLQELVVESQLGQNVQLFGGLQFDDHLQTVKSQMENTFEESGGEDAVITFESGEPKKQPKKQPEKFSVQKHASVKN